MDVITLTIPTSFLSVTIRAQTGVPHRLQNFDVIVQHFLQWPPPIYFGFVLKVPSDCSYEHFL